MDVGQQRQHHHPFMLCQASADEVLLGRSPKEEAMRETAATLCCLRLFSPFKRAMDTLQ